jgi:hypothetical protein
MISTLDKFNWENKMRKGRVAKDPQVPGNFGKNPLPKTDKMSFIKACT